MAWKELKLEEDEQLNAEEYSPYNLPVPDEEGMDRILRRGIQGVKDTLKADPDPLFNQLELMAWNVAVLGMCSLCLFSNLSP